MTASVILPADAYLDRRQLAFAGFERLGAIRATAGGLALAVDPRVAPLLDKPGSVTTHPLVLLAVLLFDGEIGSVRSVPRARVRRRRLEPVGATGGRVKI
jgi:hypothetical protein